ncbi:MAG: M56 family metallopeptidase [Lachnospiraceae bacterium]|nr:M56 family metallopeptidase [Lachnospiraceae bacterium]
MSVTFFQALSQGCKFVTSSIVCIVLWCVGMLVCMIYFTVSYVRCRFEFQTSLPVENPFAQHWLAEHPHRCLAIRQSDKISTPLTFGIWRPVILMPKSTNWENTQQLQYILMHEYIHIRRCDTLTKLLCTFALCVHWFNPMVWIMYVLFNRDVEISCDEHVVRRFGENAKSVYAKILIQMEAQRSNITTYLPLGSGFLFKIGDNAMEERITAIMKTKKKSLSAAVLAAVFIVSMTVVFATSAAGKTAEPKKTESGTGDEILANIDFTNIDFTVEECEKLLALQLAGYRDMMISDYQKAVWQLTDNREYRNLLERFSQNETLYAVYEGKREADPDIMELVTFLYNIYEPLTAEKWQTRDFSGYAVADFPNASDNAVLEYTLTLTIQDADRLTVEEYDTVRQLVMDNFSHIFETHEWRPTELRDEELMHALLDEEIECTKREWMDERLGLAIAYHYTPLGELPIDEMAYWQQDVFDEWENTLAPYVPFGLTYRYDQSIDEVRMYFKDKEVRAIYDTKKNRFISAHAGIGEGIYAKDAVDLYVEYDGMEMTGLRKATPEEMTEATKKRREVTEGYHEIFDTLREDVPATQEDYQSLFTLKTPNYRSKTIAEFNRELLDWTDHNFDCKERIAVDNSYEDYRVALTEEEKAFAAVTAHFSGMENAAYVRSIQKNEPVRDVVEMVTMRSKQEYSPGSNRSAWCSLSYAFSYHISDKDTVSVGERDDYVGGMMDSIRGFWESSTVDQLVQMTEEQMLETLDAIAEKYSSRSITITILEDQVAFETMEERKPVFHLDGI